MAEEEMTCIPEVLMHRCVVHDVPDGKAGVVIEAPEGFLDVGMRRTRVLITNCKIINCHIGVDVRMDGLLSGKK